MIATMIRENDDRSTKAGRPTRRALRALTTPKWRAVAPLLLALGCGPLDDVTSPSSGADASDLGVSVAPLNAVNLTPFTSADGRCLEAGPVDGTTRLKTQPCTGANAQQWNILGDRVRPAGNFDACLALAQPGSAPGSRLVLRPCTSTGGDLFWRYEDGQLINESNNLCVQSSIAPDGGEPEVRYCEGVRRQIWDYAAYSTYQTWNGLCFDVQGGSYSTGTPLQLWSCNRTASQRFRSEDNRIRAIGNTCLGLSGGSLADGTRVVTASCSAPESSGNFYYYNGAIVAWKQTSSGVQAKCVQPVGGATSAGTRLEVRPCTGSVAQTFRTGVDSQAAPVSTVAAVVKRPDFIPSGNIINRDLIGGSFYYSVSAQYAVGTTGPCTTSGRWFSTITRQRMNTDEKTVILATCDNLALTGHFADGGGIYFINYSTRRLEFIPNNGTARVSRGTLPATDSWTFGVLESGADLYWSQYDGIYRASKSGSFNPYRLFAFPTNTQPRWIDALDATHFYGSSYGQIIRISRSTGAVSVLHAASDVGGGGTVAIDNTDIYFLTSTYGAGNYTGAVWRLSKSGGARTQVSTVGKHASGLVVTSGFVYWAESDGSPGTVLWRRTKTSPAATLFIAGEQALSPIAANGFVFWRDGQSLRRTTLPLTPDLGGGGAVCCADVVKGL